MYIFLYICVYVYTSEHSTAQHSCGGSLGGPSGCVFGGSYRDHFRIILFSKVRLGQKLDKKVVLEEIGSGASFLVRGGGGWKAKVMLSCKRECKKHDSP